jgi:hypothetical protein
MQRTNVYAVAKERILKRFSNVLEILQSGPGAPPTPSLPPTETLDQNKEYALRQSM